MTHRSRPHHFSPLAILNCNNLMLHFKALRHHLHVPVHEGALRRRSRGGTWNRTVRPINPIPRSGDGPEDNREPRLRARGRPQALSKSRQASQTKIRPSGVALGHQALSRKTAVIHGRPAPPHFRGEKEKSQRKGQAQRITCVAYPSSELLMRRWSHATGFAFRYTTPRPGLDISLPQALLMIPMQLTRVGVCRHGSYGTHSTAQSG
jgi:hypothetical protein